MSDISEILFCEARGHKLAERVLYGSIAVEEYYFKILTAEFRHELTAHSAGRRRGGGSDACFCTDYGDGGKISLARMDGSAEGDPLRAYGGGVRGVLNVRSRKYLTACREKRRADGKSGIRTVAPLPCLKC